MLKKSNISIFAIKVSLYSKTFPELSLDVSFLFNDVSIDKVILLSLSKFFFVLDKLYNLGIEYGALGGKLTGAGGGGHLLFYCEPSKQKNLIEKMQGQGLKQVQYKFHESGCKVLDLYDFTNT